MSNKKSITGVLVCVAMLLLHSCTHHDPSYLIKEGSLLLKISLQTNKARDSSVICSDRADQPGRSISEWKLNYPVYHFECADIDADGNDDIIVGVIKPTRFDSISRKRIFIFKLIDGYIRPLWLGSRVGQPLEDFKVVRGDSLNLIRTIEMEQNGNYLVADYKWQSFGLTFVKYVSRNINLKEARNLLAISN